MIGSTTDYHDGSIEGDTDLLDLSDPLWYLDVKSMADDIGNEEVAIITCSAIDEELDVSIALLSNLPLTHSITISSVKSPKDINDEFEGDPVISTSAVDL